MAWCSLDTIKVWQQVEGRQGLANLQSMLEKVGQRQVPRPLPSGRFMGAWA